MIILKIRNLSQLKRALHEGAEFQIVEHFNKPEHTGEIRVVNKAQTNGIYTSIKGNPNHAVSKCNHGLGSWMEFGKAAEWTFTEAVGVDNLCTYAGVWTITVIDK